jgi:hypothetical protein
MNAIDPRPTISYPDDRTPIAIPDDRQLGRLADIVVACYPELGPNLNRQHLRWHDQILADWHRGFRASFRRIAALNRTDEFNLKRDLRYFADEAEDHFRLRGQPVDIRWPCYLAAAIAAGDVPFCVDGPYVGLRFDSVGSAPTAAWQAVLEDGKLRSPSRPPK